MSQPADEIKTHALESQKFTRKHLVVELDFSPASVEELEQQCDTIEYAIQGGKSPENVDLLTRLWGSYLGEVLRKQTGGHWHCEESQDGRRFALRHKDQTLYPHEQVRRRLTEGREFNLWTYFQQVARTT